MDTFGHFTRPLRIQSGKFRALRNFSKLNSFLKKIFLRSQNNKSSVFQDLQMVRIYILKPGMRNPKNLLTRLFLAMQVQIPWHLSLKQYAFTHPEISMVFSVHPENFMMPIRSTGMEMLIRSPAATDFLS